MGVGSTATLNGSYATSDLDALDATNGTVNLGGSMNNAGDTFTPTASMGTLQLVSPTITGGTIDFPAGQAPAVTGTPWFSGVIFEGELTVSNGRILYITGGITLNGTITIASTGSTTYMFWSGTQTFGGTGEIVFGGTSANNRLQQSSGTVTIGSGLTVRGGGGSIVGPVINDGTILSNESGETITTSGSALTNNGTIQATGGGNVTLNNLATNDGVFDIGAGSKIRRVGTLVLSSTSVVKVEVNGTAATDFGLLEVTSTLTLDGDLDIAYDAGGSFSSGDSFAIGTYTSASSDFGSVATTDEPTGLDTTTTVGATAFTVDLVNE